MTLWTREQKQAEMGRSWRLIGVGALVALLAWPLEAFLGDIGSAWQTLAVLALVGGVVTLGFGLVRLAYSLTHQTGE